MVWQSATDKARQIIFIFLSDKKERMLPRHYPPITFLLTGFSWLVLSSILGLAILVGLVRGTPLPPWVRLVHVHAALVGGVAQMLLGGLQAFLPPLLMTGQKQLGSHPVLFLTVNAGTVGMLVGFWLHQYIVVGTAGFLVIGAFLWIARDSWAGVQQSLASPNLWYYAVALLALLGGLACGETLAFALAQESYGYVRLAHIHLILLGFVTLVIIGTMYNLLPTVLNTSLSSPRLAQFVLILMPLGVAVLIGGFMNSSVPIEMAAGGILFVGGTLYTVNLFRTWMASTHKGNAASDHLLIGTFFFLFTIILGVLVGVNSLSNPPLMPYGRLHLVAYTHMTLVGFIINTIMGALSHFIPMRLAASRVPSEKKRGPYLDRLTTIMDRWRSVQIGGLSLGTMGLGVLASLTWNVPLTSVYIRIATWTCLGLLLSSLILFSVKLATALGRQPEDSVHPSS
ncbi:MAG: cbb3-type cytochrome c oxidase subunit I [Nitrospirae bacterium]|nr:cbb3-type cytochrome c oxidase subunit I [Nitrospirota bacterium]